MIREQLAREYVQQVSLYGKRPPIAIQRLASLFGRPLRLRNLYEPFKKHEFDPLYRDPFFAILVARQRYALRLSVLPSDKDAWEGEAWALALSLWRGKCAVCGTDSNSFTLVRDHLVPVSHVDCPGTVPSNLLPLCCDCNERKSAKDFAQWIEGGYAPACDLVMTVRVIWHWQTTICPANGWR